jgi:hypothetical protein
MELGAGGIVWARQTKDAIYWPAKIVAVSTGAQDLWSSATLPSYLVQFFATGHSAWMTDVFPYQQHRSSMTNEPFLNHGLYPAIKFDFLNAVHQADCASSDEAMMMPIQHPPPTLMPMAGNETNNDFLLTTASVFTNNAGNNRIGRILLPPTDYPSRLLSCNVPISVSAIIGFDNSIIEFIRTTRL